MNYSEKKVAFLTAAYNGEKTLQRTIDSIKAQTHQNFEYYILNDGSSDKTQEIIDKNAALDPRIHSITFPENDCQRHFIEAIRVILGRGDIDYFAICDHDDEYLPDFSQKTIDACERTGVDIACVLILYNYVDRGENTVQYYNKETVLTTPAEFAANYPSSLCSIMRTQWGKLYSIDAIRKTDLEVINIAKYGRDTIFCNEIVKNSGSVVLVPEPLYRFYIAGASETSRIEEERITAPAKLYKCAEDFVNAKCGGAPFCNDFTYMNYMNDVNLVTFQAMQSDIPIDKKIDFLIEIYSDPIFDNIAQKPNIYDMQGTTGGGGKLNFELVCDYAAKSFAKLMPSVSAGKMPKYAELATYTAVLAGYRNPMIPIMGNGPKAVILTLCHNSEKTLDKAAKSVLTQTYWNFEYILADNASTDNTREIILEIEKSDPRVKHVFFDTNKFPDVYVDLIPKILENPEYKYFAICDHDDDLFPKFLEIAVNTAQNENADLVFGAEQYYYEDSKKVINLKCDKEYTIDTPQSYSDKFGNFIYYTAWFGRLFSTELLKKTDLSSNTKLVRAHDIIIVLDAIEKSRKCVLVPDLFYRHNIGEASASRLPDKRNISSSTMQYDKIMEVYNKRATIDTAKELSFKQFICEHLLRDLLLAVTDLFVFEPGTDVVYLLLGYLDTPVFYENLIKLAPYTFRQYFIDVISEVIKRKEDYRKFADEEQKKRLERLFTVLESTLKVMVK
ncbi:MAG: glycosyltransferase [Ruminococcus sp.]|jgi:glycosyltransferase involved in cell wall biosynthesis|nr:glycosyltransferase [Ruminococcus sp.]